MFFFLCTRHFEVVDVKHCTIMYYLLLFRQVSSLIHLFVAPTIPWFEVSDLQPYIRDKNHCNILVKLVKTAMV